MYFTIFYIELFKKQCQTAIIIVGIIDERRVGVGMYYPDTIIEKDIITFLLVSKQV